MPDVVNKMADLKADFNVEFNDLNTTSLSYDEISEAIRDFAPAWNDSSINWTAMEFLNSTAYADYLVKWGQVCKVSDAWIRAYVPESGIPDLEQVWILEAEGPDVLIGSSILASPMWVWSKLVSIQQEWPRPRTNLFIHENEPQREQY